MAEQLERYRWLVAAIFAVPLLSGIAYLIYDRTDDRQPLEITNNESIRIYVSGSVNNPGVYPANPDDRWIDVIEAAGGATTDADLNAVNLSQRVQDQDQIFVPALGPVNVSGVSRPPLVDINTASQAELESLPDVGKARAEQIVQSRTAQGPFTSIFDLLARELIPEFVFERIATLVTVSP